ncbi:hypothetical protein, partial [Escherichia coli]|uniref:hypothetical protein n=1 Tax=Escherichia coli TaxID=562 RepID=UPI003F47A513
GFFAQNSIFGKVGIFGYGPSWGRWERLKRSGRKRGCHDSLSCDQSSMMQAVPGRAHRHDDWEKETLQAFFIFYF